MIPEVDSIEESTEFVTPGGSRVTWNGSEGEELAASLQRLSGRAQILLQDLLHRQHDGPVSTEGYPEQFSEELEGLVTSGLIVPVSKNEVVVPREVAFHPVGPGRRPDQLPGLLRSLPEATLEAWQESFDLPTGMEGYRPLGETLLGFDEPGPDFRNLVGDRRWLKPSDPPEGEVDSLTDLYSGDPEEAEGLQRWVLRGWLAPVLNGKNQLQYWVVTTHARSEETPKLPQAWLRDREPSVEDWSQTAFSWWEQIQMMLVLSDALPFRVTREDFPNRLDLGEVERLTSWKEAHVQNLTNVLLERDLIQPGEDRFYITNRANREKPRGLPLWIRPVLWREGLEDRTEQTYSQDFSFARHAETLLKRVLEEDERLSVDADLLPDLGWSVLWDLWASQPETLRPEPSNAPQLLRGLVDTLVECGWLDGGYAGERLVTVRANERTEDAFQAVEDHEPGDLPIILQPDGDLMVPLRSDLSRFRRINPFALMVNVDHMIEYHLDRESLVKASNEGWDCRAFKDFLEENAGSLPDPVDSLFTDLDEQAEEVVITHVHHLVEFEDEGTASRAYRALSNYEPQRVSGTLILLGKKTTEETIRRNLSRAGIQIEGASDEDRAGSPLVEVETTGPA